jgi:hypothetical protein
MPSLALLLWTLGLDGGFALQGDQYVAGPRVAARVRFVELELATLAGLGPDHLSFRSSLRARPTLEVEGFRLAAIAGVSLFHYTPRGAFDTFCDKADLSCSDTVVGLEAGLGVGFRFVALELVLATGEVPLYTFTAGVRFAL